MGIRGPKSKIRTFCRGGQGRTSTAKKWLDSIEKQKRRRNLKFVMTGEYVYGFKLLKVFVQLLQL